jgi:hypothetical protein
LLRRVAPGTQRGLASVFSYSKKDAHPGIVPSAAEQFDHIFQRRVMERWAVGGEHDFDLRE